MFIKLESVEVIKGQYSGVWIMVNKEFYVQYTEGTHEELINADAVQCAPKKSKAGFHHLNPITYYREHSIFNETRWTKKEEDLF